MATISSLGKVFLKNVEKRSEVIGELNVLCHANKLQDPGWALCRNVRSGLCTVCNGTKRYQPNVGKAFFHLKVEHHSKEGSKLALKMVVVPKDQRKSITDAAAYAVALEVPPLRFFYNKRGMLQFLKALIRLAHSYAPRAEINVEKLLPGSDKVRKRIIDRTLENQKNQLGSIVNN